MTLKDYLKIQNLLYEIRKDVEAGTLPPIIGTSLAFRLIERILKNESKN